MQHFLAGFVQVTCNERLLNITKAQMFCRVGVNRPQCCLIFSSGSQLSFATIFCSSP